MSQPSASVSTITERQKMLTNLKENSFEWCCKPVVRWIRLLGIPLFLETNSRRLFFITLAVGLFLLCLNIARLMISLHLFALFSKHSNKHEIGSTIWSSMFINIFNKSAFTLGTQLSLLSSTLVNWKSLATVLHRMEDLQLFSFQHFRQFRHVFKWGLAFLIMVTIC